MSDQETLSLAKEVNEIAERRISNASKKITKTIMKGQIEGLQTLITRLEEDKTEGLREDTEKQLEELMNVLNCIDSFKETDSSIGIKDEAEENIRKKEAQRQAEEESAPAAAKAGSAGSPAGSSSSHSLLPPPRWLAWLLLLGGAAPVSAGATVYREAPSGGVYIENGKACPIGYPAATYEQWRLCTASGRNTVYPTHVDDGEPQACGRKDKPMQARAALSDCYPDPETPTPAPGPTPPLPSGGSDTEPSPWPAFFSLLLGGSVAVAFGGTLVEHGYKMCTNKERDDFITSCKKALKGALLFGLPIAHQVAALQTCEAASSGTLIGLTSIATLLELIQNYEKVSKGDEEASKAAFDTFIGHLYKTASSAFLFGQSRALKILTGMCMATPELRINVKEFLRRIRTSEFDWHNNAASLLIALSTALAPLYLSTEATSELGWSSGSKAGFISLSFIQTLTQLLAMDLNYKDFFKKLCCCCRKGSEQTLSAWYQEKDKTTTQIIESLSTENYESHDRIAREVIEKIYEDDDNVNPTDPSTPLAITGLSEEEGPKVLQKCHLIATQIQLAHGLVNDITNSNEVFNGLSPDNKNKIIACIAENEITGTKESDKKLERLLDTDDFKKVQKDEFLRLWNDNKPSAIDAAKMAVNVLTAALVLMPKIAKQNELQDVGAQCTTTNEPSTNHSIDKISWILALQSAYTGAQGGAKAMRERATTSFKCLMERFYPTEDEGSTAETLVGNA
jgi:hypothetical protein